MVEKASMPMMSMAYCMKLLRAPAAEQKSWGEWGEWGEPARLPMIVGVSSRMVGDVVVVVIDRMGELLVSPGTAAGPYSGEMNLVLRPWGPGVPKS